MVVLWLVPTLPKHEYPDIRQQKRKDTSSIQNGAQGQWFCTEHDLLPRGATVSYSLITKAEQAGPVHPRDPTWHSKTFFFTVL